MERKVLVKTSEYRRIKEREFYLVHQSIYEQPFTLTPHHQIRKYYGLLEGYSCLGEKNSLVYGKLQTIGVRERKFLGYFRGLVRCQSENPQYPPITPNLPLHHRNTSHNGVHQFKKKLYSLFIKCIQTHFVSFQTHVSLSVL